MISDNLLIVTITGHMSLKNGTTERRIFSMGGKKERLDDPVPNFDGVSLFWDQTER